MFTHFQLSRSSYKCISCATDRRVLNQLCHWAEGTFSCAFGRIDPLTSAVDYQPLVRIILAYSLKDMWWILWLLSFLFLLLQAYLEVSSNVPQRKSVRMEAVKPSLKLGFIKSESERKIAVAYKALLHVIYRIIQTIEIMHIFSNFNQLDDHREGTLNWRSQ